MPILEQLLEVIEYPDTTKTNDMDALFNLERQWVREVDSEDTFSEDELKSLEVQKQVYSSYGFSANTELDYMNLCMQNVIATAHREQRLVVGFATCTDLIDQRPSTVALVIFPSNLWQAKERFMILRCVEIRCWHAGIDMAKVDDDVLVKKILYQTAPADTLPAADEFEFMVVLKPARDHLDQACSNEELDLQNFCKKFRGQEAPLIPLAEARGYSRASRTPTAAQPD